MQREARARERRQREQLTRIGVANEEARVIMNDIAPAENTVLDDM